MRNVFMTAALCVAASSLSIATPALAATEILFSGNSSTDGTDGNIRSFSNGGVSVQASGWSVRDGTTLENAYLGAYGGGLGVTNRNEGNGASNNSHTIDNVGQFDFVLLVFNAAVNIASAKLNPFAVSSDPLDNDAQVSFGNLAGAFNAANPTAVPVNSPVWSQLDANDYTVSGNNTSPYSTSLNSAGNFGNVWLIGAARTNPDSRGDGFKLGAITVNTLNSAVPEPGTWAMMLLGFGMLGAVLRRRNTSVSTSFRFA